MPKLPPQLFSYFLPFSCCLHAAPFHLCICFPSIWEGICKNTIKNGPFWK